MKKIFLIIFLILTLSSFSSFIFAENYSIEGTWLKCITNIDSFSCSPSEFESIMNPMVSSAKNSCIVVQISKSQDGYSIVNYFTNEKYTDVNYQNNEINFKTNKTQNNINYTTNTICDLDSETSGKCKDSLIINYSNYYSCQSTISSTLLKIDILKNSNYTNNLTELISLLKNGTKGTWKLFGTSFEITDMSIFENVKSVWAWDGTKWNIYSSDPNIYNLLIKYKIPVIEKIDANSGFWVNF